MALHPNAGTPERKRAGKPKMGGTLRRSRFFACPTGDGDRVPGKGRASGPMNSMDATKESAKKSATPLHGDKLSHTKTIHVRASHWEIFGGLERIYGAAGAAGGT